MKDLRKLEVARAIDKHIYLLRKQMGMETEVAKLEYREEIDRMIAEKERVLYGREKAK